MMSYKIFAAFIFTILISSFGSTLLAQEESTAVELEKQLMAHPVEDTTRVDLLIDLFKTYFLELGETEKGEKYINEAYQLARKLKDPKRTVIALLRISYILFKNQKLTDCMLLMKEGFDICKAHNLVQEELKILSNFGNISSLTGSLNKAEEYYNQAYELAKSTGKKELLVLPIIDLGHLYSGLGSHAKAIEKYQEAISYKNIIEDKSHIESAYANIGEEYSYINELAKAQEAFDSCQATIDRYKLSNFSQCRLYRFYGNFYHKKLNNPKKAIELLNKILAMPEQTTTRGEIALIYAELAVAHLDNNDIREALKCSMAGKAIVDLEKEIELTIVRSIYKCMYLCKAGLNEWDEAFVYAHKANELADSITIQEEAELANHSLVAHEIESNERELIKKNNKIEQQKRAYETIGFLAIPILIILFTLFYYINKLARSKERISMQLSYSETLEKKIEERTQELGDAHKIIDQAKERENMSLALLNHRHMGLLSSLSEKLESWEEVNANIGIKDIRSVLHDIKAAQSETEEWGSFMLHFERIHPDFVQKLISICPSLSNNELKHCAYMKLGLARKYVAEIQRSSEDAVKLARNRIRKKLDFDADMSLQEYINML